MLKPDNQKRNNQNGGGPNNKKNLVGLISIILWALILTLLLQSAFSLFEGSDHVEIPYSTFRSGCGRTTWRAWTSRATSWSLT